MRNQTNDPWCSHLSLGQKETYVFKTLVYFLLGHPVPQHGVRLHEQVTRLGVNVGSLLALVILRIAARESNYFRLSSFNGRSVDIKGKGENIKGL